MPAEHACAAAAWSGPQTRARIETVLCDARISRVLLDHHGQVTGLQSLTDSITPAQRRALAARDLGCVARGCTRPPAFCDAHHLHARADGAPTTLANLVLLCRRHHVLWHLGKIALQHLKIPWHPDVPGPQPDGRRRPVRHSRRAVSGTGRGDRVEGTSAPWLPPTWLHRRRLPPWSSGSASSRSASRISPGRGGFYEELGWRGQEVSQTVFFQAGGMALVLWSRQALAQDAGVEDRRTGAFGGIALAHNTRSAEEVDALVAAAARAGATVTRRPAPTSYGGYAGCFTDPDGHVWEIAHNPGFGLADDGSLVLPDFGTA